MGPFQAAAAAAGWSGPPWCSGWGASTIAAELRQPKHVHFDTYLFLLPFPSFFLPPLPTYSPPLPSISHVDAEKDCCGRAVGGGSERTAGRVAPVSPL